MNGLIVLACLAAMGMGAFELWVALRDLLFGSVEWEVSAVGHLASAFGLPAMGLGGLLVLSLARRRIAFAMAAGVVFVVVGIGWGLAALLMLTDLPMVWQATRDFAPQTGAAWRLVTIKSFLQALVFAGACLPIGAVAMLAALRTRAVK